ncbi:hypothetical protein HZB00_02395 [Candidatus Woesearchaeota archaeon]|nr:hypothetical protein [Candidatus Woesearchaeota archaeon]
MQERLALRQTLKKVAALGTSVAMLGMTITGAVAQEQAAASSASLSSFPKAFTTNTVVVVGSHADPADNLAASAVEFALGAASASASSSSSSTSSTTSSTTPSTGAVQLEDGYSKEIVLGTALTDSTNAFGATVRETRIPTFKKGTVTISIGGTTNSYNWHEEVGFRADSNATVTSSLALANQNQANEQYKDNVLLRLPSSSIRYAYVFDTALKTNNYISNATQTDPITLDFLGKTLVIQNCNSSPCTGATTAASSITALSGDKFPGLHKGDTIMYQGKKISVDSLASSGAAINVDGNTIVVSNNNQRTDQKSGLQIRAEDLLATGTSGEGLSTVSLIIGKDNAIKTYNDGDYFIGQDKYTPLWTWSLAGINGGNPSLNVTLGQTLTSYSITGIPNYPLTHPPYLGDVLCWPNNYICVQVSKVSQTDDLFGEYVLRPTQRDLYATDDSVVNFTSANVLELTALGQKDTGINAGGDTQSVYFYPNATYGLLLYKKKQDSSHAILVAAATNTLHAGDGATAGWGGAMDAVAFANANGTTMLPGNFSASVFTLNYKSSSIPVDIAWNSSVSLANITLTGGSGAGALKINPSGTANDIVVVLQAASTGLTYLGQSQSDTVRGGDLAYNGTTAVDISGFREDGRTVNGIIVRSYYKSAPSDTLQFALPPDISNYKATVKLARAVGAGVVGTVVPGSTSTSGVSEKLDTDVVNSLSQWNVISVGGPAINSVSAKLKGLPFPSYGDASGIKPNEGVVELMPNGSNWALLVAGYEKDNTQAAGEVLKNYADYNTQLSGKTSVVVKGLKATGITVA